MAQRWDSLLDVSVRGFARALDDRDLSEARSWAATACAILSAEAEGTPEQRAFLDVLEYEMRGEALSADPCPICERRIPAASRSRYCSPGCRSAWMNYLRAEERARWFTLPRSERIATLEAGRERHRAKDRARREARAQRRRFA